MNKLIFVILLAVLLPFAAAAQSTEHRGQGYFFVAPGVNSAKDATLHIGGGGEGLVYKGLGMGGEIGYITRNLSGGAGVLSPHVSYNFLNASESGKFVPFVTGGYSWIFPSDARNAIHVGGGMNWWFKDSVGLRLEFRDHIITNPSSSHIIGFRIGLAFR